MPMTRDEFNNLTNAILAADEIDRGKLSEDLATLRQGFNDEVTAKEAAEKTRDDLAAANENLKTANLNLFMKCGESGGAPEDPHAPKPETRTTPAEKFAALFDDRGELK